MDFIFHSEQGYVCIGARCMGSNFGNCKKKKNTFFVSPALVRSTPRADMQGDLAPAQSSI